MKITWLGHSCFKIESKGFCIVIDPFEDGYVPGFDNIRENADCVLCSHSHNDHCAAQCVNLSTQNCEAIFTVTKINTYHDDQKGALRGENTIHIIDDGEVKIAHFGDLGCMPEQTQLDMLKNLDCILIPIGGFYTIGADTAKQITDIISPNAVIPMHYKSDSFGFDVLAGADSYTSLCDDTVEYNSNSITIDASTKKQTAILKYK